VISLTDECKPKTPEDIDFLAQGELPIVPNQDHPEFDRYEKLF